MTKGKKGNSKRRKTGIPSFDKIYKRAAKRKGGPAALEALLPAAKKDRALSRLADARYLAEMAKCIFRAGFNWKVVEHKWPGFEEAFDGFDPPRVAKKTEAQLNRLAKDQRIIRNRGKIDAVRDNALFVATTSLEHDGFGRFLARWPSDDIVGLLDHLKSEGSRLGGHTGQYFLRFVGKDTFVLSTDVVKSLVKDGVVDKQPGSKSSMRAVQAAFNAWAEESRRPLCQVSRILACSVE